MNYIKLVISIAIPLFIGFIGSFFTSSSVDTWYKTLKKPDFNPPNWVFSPVWTLLFILIGLSFYIIWKNNFGGKKVLLLNIFFTQLFANLIWSLFFFGLRSPFWALIDIIVLWLAILVNIIVFYRVSKPAGILLVPYILWVSFAALLNFYLYILNK
ncbi:MAG TPA: tryptophan-rich sensory protein [Spirochaetota bacterium]|jgi:tryptophan-rich sensory protein|nr:tryptophan-rich sensory protein [Spirochaetota bacterium]OQA99629.1 MAG: TspO/MBR family protein [Spirochaetes bacterium ADurb.Bin218]HOK91754.1 tryptophan-rich sensory protein [Spirochaetota bacterium]HON15020.1 tryptophan-rich sensory protein [Spirochaetota bacterium]HOQ11140.1 tryptophan-rich sensory protein [Spirochaetota bacterium]